MNASDAYSRVQSEAGSQFGYSRKIHTRVSPLIDEWLAEHRGSQFALSASQGASDDEFSDGVDDCAEYVQERYKQKYGIFPIIGFLFVPVIYGIISWIVQRTLNHLFNRPDGYKSPSARMKHDA